VPEDYFDEWVASRYDATSADMFASRERFTRESVSHVSVWEKPMATG
jgi:hypothetical protein